jgi:DNA-binding transcriptional ArsR family regulator
MSDDRLSITFAALADPTRRAILARLAAGPATVNELAEPFPISLQAISRHLKVLEQAGLITRGRDAQFRPCHLETEPLETAAAWIEQHRRIWDDRFDQLDRHLLEVKAQQQQPPTRSTRSTRSTRPTPKRKKPDHD